MRILGIDPGIERVGWGIVDAINGNSIYQECGCIQTSKKIPHSERIASISQELKKIIKKFKPDHAIVEKLFFAKNKKTALTVSEARGAILFVLSEANIVIHEFTPLQVKLGLTGNGRAEKKQVEWVVKNILKIKEDIRSDDAYDALALCLMIRK
ncbi:MAG: crossover junction endodeoxyribonuclease RuvC [Patescibacteria group bacterium]